MRLGPGVRISFAPAESSANLRSRFRDEIPEPTDGGRTYAFPIRQDVKLQDGSVLTAHDVAASWNKIVAPSDGVISARSGYYSMVDKGRSVRPENRGLPSQI